MAKNEERTSVLATLTAAVMDEKKAAARTLTPIPGELSPAPNPLPHDLPGAYMSNETMIMTAKDLRMHAARLLEIADALDVVTGVPAAAEADAAKLAATEVKLAEREADRQAKERNFNADFEAKSQAAQLAAFGPDEVEVEDTKTDAEVEDEYEGPKADDWTCPEHDRRATKTSAKTGREFIGCPECNEYEGK